MKTLRCCRSSDCHSLSSRRLDGLDVTIQCFGWSWRWHASSAWPPEKNLARADVEGALSESLKTLRIFELGWLRARCLPKQRGMTLEQLRKAKGLN
jgi:hypothetical protein